MKMSRMRTKSPSLPQALLLTFGLSVLVLGVIALSAPARSWASLMARGSGHLSFALLGVVLLTSPLARFHRVPWTKALVRWRRSLGIAMLFPALLHFALVLWSTPDLLAGVIQPHTDLPGAIALTLLVIMGVTSRTKTQRSMGPQRWKRLHRRLILAAFALTAPAAVNSEYLPMGVLATLICIVVLSYRWHYFKARGVSSNTPHADER